MITPPPDSQPSRTVIHLSDLHFGREDPAVVDALVARVRTLQPDVVAVSGDFTQRARRQQFFKARAFLDALPFPRIVVPGNHDVPLYNLAARLLDPLGGYRRHITNDLAPVYRDELMTIVGMNTTRPLTLKSGIVRESEVRRITGIVEAGATSQITIVVGHHPFEVPGESRDAEVPGGALDELTQAGVDVFLTGHLHVSYTGPTAHRYRIGGRSAVVVEAGTATSTRLREEANAFNVLRIRHSDIVVEHHVWQGSAFDTTARQRFLRRDAGGWLIHQP